MPNAYLDLARQGKNAWWRYLIALVIIVLFYQVIGAIPLVMLSVALSLDDDPTTGLNPETLQFEGVPPLLPYLAINALLIGLLVGLWIAVRGLHRRRLITLITPRDRIDWRRIFLGFGLYFGLIAIASAGGSLIRGHDIQFTLDVAQFLVFLPIALIVTPLQTSAEELFFRGYIMQGLALKLPSPWLPMVGSSILFMLPHLLNPEAAAGLAVMALLYLFLGLFLAFITVKDQSLELALGVHAANNLFVVLVLNYANSALPSPSIFTAGDLNPVSSLISMVLVAGIFCLVMFGGILKQPGRTS